MARSFATDLPMPYTIEGAVACRTWDDFLTVAAQRWETLREELRSGRLGEYLTRIHRAELLPRADAGQSLDEQLDRWLGRLPASRPSAPELDVHPAAVVVPRAGGTTRHALRISNVGYRLLRSTARIEPDGGGWVRIVSPVAGREFQTVEESELTVEVTATGRRDADAVSEIVIESNGGTRRIPVRLAALSKPPVLPDAAVGSAGPTIADVLRPVAIRMARARPATRVVAGIIAAMAVRGLVLASSLVPIGPVATTAAQPRLPALAIVCAVLGAIAGLLTGRRREGNRAADAAPTAVASALLGIAVAAVVHALVSTVERPMGVWASSYWAVGLVWGIIGAAAAGVSCGIVPYRP